MADRVLPPKGQSHGGQRRVDLAPDAIQDLLAKSVLFPDRAVVFGIADRIEAYEYPAGTTIVRAGTAGDSICLLTKGRASVAAVNAATGELQVMETLRPGDHFGEIGPLLGAAHTHSVVADDPCQVLVIPKEVMQSLFARVPSFSHAIARRLATRVVHLGLTALRPAAVSPSIEPSRKPAPAAAEPAQALPKGTIRFVEVSDFEPSGSVLAMLPVRLMLEQRLVPLQLKDASLTVGMVNPRSEVAHTELKRVLHEVSIDAVAISADDFQHALVRFRLTGGAVGERGSNQQIRPESLTFQIIDSEREAEKAIKVVGDEVVRAVNRIIAAALDREASDVHIEPDSGGVRVRFRVHGILQDWSEYVAASFAKGIVARLKILSGLDITERRMPQDGRIAVTVGKREVDLRLSTLPASQGEKVVLRIFEAANVMRPLERTFVHPGVLSAIRKSLGGLVGAILVAGGTGSGKSTTLYSMIAELRKNRPDTNVLMVEDPIEYRFAGVTQVQVNHGIGLGFAQVLRAMLRQDPDVIALGETRDTETARTALEAAMTGHLLLTSLHANDALSSVHRLETLGCSRELIAQSVSLVLVQRLVRRLCPNCAASDVPTPAMRDALAARRLVERDAAVRIPRAVGCDGCHQSGYLGRVAVVESLQMNEEVRAALLSAQPVPEVNRIALKSGALLNFQAYSSHLMSRSLISGADALMAVAG